MLLAKGAPAIAQDILNARSMQLLSVPELDFFMSDSEKVEIYPWEGDYDEMKNKTFLILHTSGSTGIPKPVFVTHGIFASNDAHQLIPSLGGAPTLINYFTGKRFFVAFPPFHAANLYFTIGYNVFSGMTCVMPPVRPPSADIVDAIHTHGNLDGTVLPPSLVTDIFNTSEYYLNMTRRLKFVAYVGGVLSNEVGDPLAKKMKVITLMGATELGYLPVMTVDKDTAWQHVPLSPFLGHKYRPARDGLSELVIVRNPELDPFQGVFSAFPNLHEYPTSDLYELDPADTGDTNSWVFRARDDDIICFTNAEKLNPVTMEAIISSHPAVQAAVIGGSGEFQAALLVEPKADVHTPEDKKRLLNDIWPTVMYANRDCPAHGRILKNFVMFTTPGKGLPMAAKGTVQRYAALKLYSEEFKSLYATTRKRENLQPDAPSHQINPAPEANASNDMKKQTPVMNSSFASHPLPANFSIDSELDMRIEKTLNRLLPVALAQNLGPALVRMTTDLLQRGAAQQNKETKRNEFEQDDGLETGDSSPHSVSAPVSKGNGAFRVAAEESRMSNDEAQGGSTDKTLQDLQDGLRHAIAESTYLYGMNDQADFFVCGLDSLQVAGLTNEINELLTKLQPGTGLIKEKVIYENSSFEKLLAVLQENVTVHGESSV